MLVGQCATTRQHARTLTGRHYWQEGGGRRGEERRRQIMRWYLQCMYGTKKQDVLQASGRVHLDDEVLLSLGDAAAVLGWTLQTAVIGGMSAGLGEWVDDEWVMRE